MKPDKEQDAEQHAGQPREAQRRIVKAGRLHHEAPKGVGVQKRGDAFEHQHQAKGNREFLPHHSVTRALAPANGPVPMSGREGDDESGAYGLAGVLK